MEILAFTGNEQEELEDYYLGVVEEFKSPLNIYFDLETLLDSDIKIAYFIAYTIGKEKNILWGIYDKVSGKFIFDNGCHYNAKQLFTYTKTWKENNYVYMGNIVKNRIIKRITKHLGQNYGNFTDLFYDVFLLRYLLGLVPEYELPYINGKILNKDDLIEELSNKVAKTNIITRKQYINYKKIIAYFDGKIDSTGIEDILEKFYNDVYKFYNISEDNTEIDDYIEFYINNLKYLLKIYETNINLIDISKNINEDIYDLVKDLLEKFYHQVETGEIVYANTYKKCPDLQECQKYNTLCSSYYYGKNYQYLSELDPRTFLE